MASFRENEVRDPQQTILLRTTTALIPSAARAAFSNRRIAALHASHPVEIDSHRLPIILITSTRPRSRHGSNQHLPVTEIASAAAQPLPAFATRVSKGLRIRLTASSLSISSPFCLLQAKNAPASETSDTFRKSSSRFASSGFGIQGSASTTQRLFCQHSGCQGYSRFSKYKGKYTCQISAGHQAGVCHSKRLSSASYQNNCSANLSWQQEKEIVEHGNPSVTHVRKSRVHITHTLLKRRRHHPKRR